MKDQKVWHAEFRQDSKVVYVQDPSIRGKTRYLRTHLCVLTVACPDQTCRSGQGVPCVNAGSSVAWVHVVRKDVFYGRVESDAKRNRGEHDADDPARISKIVRTIKKARGKAS